MSLPDDAVWVAGEHALHSALESLPGISVIVFDHEMRIRALYGSALVRHGYVHARMLGRPTPEVMPAPVWERLGPLYAAALAGETITFEQRSQDGKAYYASTVSPVRHDGRVVGGAMTSRDITAEKTAERSLSEAKAQMQSILDHSPMAIYMRDLEQHWLVTNAEACRFIGRSAGDLLGKSMTATLTPEWAAQMGANDREVIRTGEATHFDEYAPDRESGETRHFWSQKFPVRDDDGEIRGVGGISLDVTDRERATRELVAARELFEKMFESAVVGMLVSRITGADSTDIVECNPAFAHMLGAEPDDLIGSAGKIFVHPDDLPERARLLAEVLAGRPAAGELRLHHREGHYIDALMAPSLVTDADGQKHIVMQAIDISERKRLELELRRFAERDALTGLFSRRRFLEELDREVSRAGRHGRPGALLLLDLDGFKAVNDSFGHAAGDEVLMRVAGSLRRALRESDVLARMGGDEFALILPDTDAAASWVVAGKLVEAVRAQDRVAGDGRRRDVTASVGITAVSGGRELDAAKLLIEADVAMYQAKSAGKDGVAVYGCAGSSALT